MADNKIVHRISLEGADDDAKMANEAAMAEIVPSEKVKSSTRKDEGAAVKIMRC